MAKPPIKVTTPDNNKPPSTSTPQSPRPDVSHQTDGQGTVRLPDSHLQGTDRTTNKPPANSTPDNTRPTDPVVVVTDLPSVGHSAPDFPEDMRIFDSTVDGELTFGEHSGLSLSRTGDLYAHLTHIGEIAIQINSKGQFEIATGSQYRMVLEQIEGTPQWQKKVSLSDPGVSRGESMTGSSFPVPLDRLFIAITSARRLTAPDMDGIRQDKQGRKYVDLENSRTVMVVPVNDGQFQATNGRVLIPNGPMLERIGRTAAWRIEQDGPGPSKRPRVDEPSNASPAQPEPLQPATVWDGTWQPTAGGAIRPFALRHSNHATRFSWDSFSWSSQNPLYPFTAERGQRKKYIDLFEKGPATLKAEPNTSNIQQKVQTLTQWGLKIDLHALRFLKVPGQVVTEVLDMNGGLIADILGHKVHGQPTIQRFIEPMSGSGFYTNYARTVGFQGHIITNDINPLFSWTQSEIIRQPDKVIHYINSIKEDLITLALEHDIVLDHRTLSVKFENIEASKAFTQSAKVREYRGAVKSYFDEIIDVVVDLNDGHIEITRPPTERASVIVRAQGSEIIISAPPTSDNGKAFLAAVIYIAQNNNTKNSGTVEIKQLNNGQYSFHFPVTTMYKEDVRVRLLKSGLVNNGHINYISDLHTSAKHPTQVLNKDGWDLLDTIHEANNQTSNKSDLIILSGHFSDIYLTERDFIKKIMRHVMPLSENGASIIITNSFSHYKETAFNTLGFSTFKKSRASNDKAKGDYLLALNEHAMRAALVETP